MQDLYQQVAYQDEGIRHGFLRPVASALQVSVLDVVANIRDCFKTLPIKRDTEILEPALDVVNAGCIAADSDDGDLTDRVATRFKTLRQQQPVGLLYPAKFLLAEQ